MKEDLLPSGEEARRCDDGAGRERHRGDREEVRLEARREDEVVDAGLGDHRNRLQVSTLIINCPNFLVVQLNVPQCHYLQNFLTRSRLFLGRVTFQMSISLL